MYGTDSSTDLLLLFQRHLVQNIYSTLSPSPSTLSSPSHHEVDAMGSQQVQDAISVLIMYASILHDHVVQILPLASQLVAQHFRVASQVLKEGPVTKLLPELSVCLVLLQLKMSFQFLESKFVPLVWKMMKLLDEFNHLAPTAMEDEEEDLAWPDGKGGGG